MDTIVLVFTTLFGLLVGSFLNALIYRLPRGINIAYPRSSCTSCQKVILWYENLPILSYLFLRGRCSKCKSKISIEYPLVELGTAVVAYLMAPRELSVTAIMSFFFFFSVFCCFLVHFIVDLKHQILPDGINIYLAILFFVISFINYNWTHWVLGGAIGLGFPLLVTWIFYLIKGQVGLGGGDIKLFGALGIYLGPVAVMQNIFISCMLGAVVGLVLMGLKIIKKENPIPFGPFILVVGAVQIFFPNIFQQLISHIP